MASGSIKKPVTEDMLNGKVGFSYLGNVSSTDLDNLIDVGLYETYITNGAAKYSNIWAMVVVTSHHGNGVVEQVEITNSGIAKRHKEGGTWTGWKGVNFS